MFFGIHIGLPPVNQFRPLSSWQFRIRRRLARPDHRASPPRRGRWAPSSASRIITLSGLAQAESPLGAALLNGTHHAARVQVASPLGRLAPWRTCRWWAWQRRTARSVVHARLLCTTSAMASVMWSRTTSWTCIPAPCGCRSALAGHLQTGAKNYVQGVVPAVADWIDAINDATEFVITRAADTSVGRIEYEMARAPLEQISIARGPTNYTATLSGYSTAFAENEEPDAAYDRTLTGIRSTTTGTAATRVRCAIDWLLRPGQRAYYDEGASFVVSYINYYVPATGDAYMDVGE